MVNNWRKKLNSPMKNAEKTIHRTPAKNILLGGFVFLFFARNFSLGNQLGQLLLQTLGSVFLQRTADVPVVTNGGPALKQIAQERGWRILDLFETS
jgi:hypothetical protein